jgi:isoquinoline 1-oxidoreductase alpha subunit
MSMAQDFTLNINGRALRLRATPDTPLLWALRDHLKLTGTKFGCGQGLCGACTVHLDGAAIRSCTVEIGSLEADAKVTTIEALAAAPDNPVIRAWEEADVPQCGYCQPGQIMAAAAFLKENPRPSREEIRAGMTNLCRCGTYQQIEAAIARAAELAAAKGRPA